jgi:ABC-type sulfate transport system permease component
MKQEEMLSPQVVAAFSYLLPLLFLALSVVLRLMLKKHIKTSINKNKKELTSKTLESQIHLSLSSAALASASFFFFN